MPTTIPLKPNSKRQFVVIDSDTLAFKDWKVRLDDVTGLSFGLHSREGYLSSSGAHVLVHTASSQYKIRTNNIGVLGYLESKDNMQQVMDAVREAITPRLLWKQLSYIFEQRIPVRIARFTLAPMGLSYRGLTGTTQVPWSYKASCRTVSKIRWLTGGTLYGVQEVFYFDPRTGKNAVLGTVSSADMNGFLLPIMLEIIASRLPTRG